MSNIRHIKCQILNGMRLHSPPLMMVTVVETSDVIACTVVVLHFHIAQLRCGPCVVSNKGGDDDF